MLRAFFVLGVVSFQPTFDIGVKFISLEEIKP